MTAKPKSLRFLDFGSALMWGLAWLVLTYVLATPAAGVASFVGAVLAFFVGRQFSGRPLRTPTVVVAFLLLTPVLLWLAEWPARSPFVSGLFPSAEAVVLFTDLLWWGAAALTVVGCLQFLSNRYQLFVSLEVLTVAIFFAAPFAAHRDGFINRPYFLIDPLWSRGYDPVPILQAIGVVIAVVLILLTVGRATERSSVVDVLLLCALALGLYLYMPQDVLRDLVADPPGNSGLTGDPEEAAKQAEQRAKEGQGGQGAKEGNPDENPFPFETNEPDDPKPVAVVVFRDDYEPPDGYYYFRQSAFSQYNGFRLVKDVTNEANTDLFPFFPTREETREAPPERAEVPTKALDTRIALLTSHKEPFGLVSPLEMSPAPNPNPDKFERVYDVESRVFTGGFSQLMASDLHAPQWTPEVVKHYLQYPDGDPRYKQLADEIVRSIRPEYRDLPFAQALSITLYLGEKGVYSLRRRPVQGSKDPTADFLFGDMTGYCVHFSHAAVYLMRAAGIPSRVGVGYAVEGRNRRGSALLIRSSEAHAWPEVWIDGLGWTPLDVAPQTNLESGPPPPDFDLQAMLAEMAREEAENYETQKQFDLRKFLKQVLALLWNFAPWLLGALLFLCYGLKAERRLSHHFEKGNDKVHALYKAAMDRAGEAGFRRRYGQGRLAFSEEHLQHLPSLTPITRSHLALKFGNQSEADVQEMVHCYKKLGAELAQASPLWRRLLGLLNPVSWLSTK